MSRLPAVLLSSRSTSGAGFKAWETRRANKLGEAVRLLVAHAGRQCRMGQVDELMLAAQEIGEQIDANAPYPTPSLPCGYHLVTTRFGGRSLAHSGFAFSSCEPVDMLDAMLRLARLGQDLKVGLLHEIQADFEGWGRE